MHLLITGPARSGKSTALRRLAGAALAAPASAVLLADGRGVTLSSFAAPSRPVFGPDDAASLAEALAAAADRLTCRCAALAARGLREAPADAPRELVIIDEVQVFTRHPIHGKTIRDALTRIAEQGGALGDLLILVAPRATGTLPPALRVTLSAQLRMLGAGHYQLVADGTPARQGYVDTDAPLADAAALTVDRLPEALGLCATTRPAPVITRYEGGPGSGKTYALQQHTADPALRRVWLDVRAHSHRSLLLDCIQQCGATPPEGALISGLITAAALAVQSQPTLLLLDNVDGASAKTIDSIHRLLDGATEAAMSMRPAAGDQTKDLLGPLRRRAASRALQPLDPQQANALVQRVAPAIEPASTQAVVRRAAGNPQALVAYAERVAAHGDDERHKLAPVRPPARWLSILLMFSVLVAVILIQRQIANDIAGAVLSGLVVLVMWYIRPRFREATRR